MAKAEPWISSFQAPFPIKKDRSDDVGYCPSAFSTHTSSRWSAGSALTSFVASNVEHLSTFSSEDGSLSGQFAKYFQFHDQVQKLYKCPKCGMTYAHFPSLCRHRRKCEGRYELVCTVCEKIFFRKDHYWDHLRRGHNIIDKLQPRVVFSRK